MAQDFKNFLTKYTTADAVTPIGDATDSNDTVIGIRCTNILTTAIVVSVYITNTAVDYYVGKDVSIPPGGGYEFIEPGAKIVLMSGDQLNAVCDTLNGCDFVVSRVDAISA